LRMLSRLRALLSGHGHRSVRPSVIDTGVFDQKFYADITSARLGHFRTLGLPVSGKSVLDVGAGVGHLSTAIAAAGGDVTCIDGREENILRLRELYPDRQAHVVDVETDALLDLGRFDGIFCYGLLYHLFDPLSFIRRVSRICNEWLIIETCISDSTEPILRLVPEENANYSQAIHAMGCRPSSAYVIFCLKLAGFENVYVTSTLPDHPQFRYKNRNDGSYLRGGNLMRNIFVASRTSIPSPALTRC
jgi:SAM-dependent methyltransferase